MRELLKKMIKLCVPISILFLFVRIFWGFRKYCKIKQQYGEDVQILVCPHKGTGDIYMIGRYLDVYLKRQGIANNLFLFRGKAERRVGELFHIDNGIVITDRETVSLMRLLAFIGQNKLDIHHLHHIPFTPQTEIAALLEGYNGLSFDDLFRYHTFGFDNNPVTEKRPCFSVEEEYIERFFSHNSLVKQKTVIISPYASSIPDLPEQVWNKLVDKLHKNGYSVATNCMGEKEPPLKNTISVSPPFSAIGPVLEAAGYFIGWRSGLCDLVSGCDCKKVILYPYEAPRAMWIDWPGKTYAYFNLADCHGSQNTIEIEFEERHISTLAETIYDAVTKR